MPYECLKGLTAAEVAERVASGETSRICAYNYMLNWLHMDRASIHATLDAAFDDQPSESTSCPT
jgi:hypothetical protein